MTENERLTSIRKSLNMTMEKFGERIGVSKTTISGIETGRRNLTEHMTKSICREFNVNYTWLTTGEGEMFFQSDDLIVSKVEEIMAGCNETHKNLLTLCATKLDEQDLKAIERIIEKYLEIQEKQKEPERTYEPDLEL